MKLGSMDRRKFLGGVAGAATVVAAPQFALGQAGAGLSDITAGPDAAMWVSAQDGTITRITSAGAITALALPAGSNPDGIAAGPGHSVWVAETVADAIAEITLDHAR